MKVIPNNFADGLTDNHVLSVCFDIDEILRVDTVAGLYHVDGYTIINKVIDICVLKSIMLE
jgi:hypothetical protein